MASEALSISGIDSYYGDSHVLHGVGFALQAGRLLGLLGRNGAGKTTCMATIMGFLRPRRGLRKPMMVDMQVVLPAPLRPSNPSNPPARNAKPTPCSTWLSP